MKTGRGSRNSRTRQFVMAAFDAALLRGWVAKWSYRFGLHGKLGVTSHNVHFAGEGGLPRPLTVAFASDFHAGPSTDPRMFEVLVRELRAQKPDVLLLGGDYVSYEAECVDVLAEALSQCNPPFGKYGVVGNHDLWTDDERIIRQLASAGVQVLVNRNVSLPPPFDRVSICGIDDPWTGNADARKAFENAGSIRIFLTHSPDGLLLLGEERFHVGFAGHTHGGQVALPGGTPIMSAGGPLSRSYGRGRFDIPGSGPLIVSRGVGCSTLPIRVNADPELVICTLHS